MASASRVKRGRSRPSRARDALDEVVEQQRDVLAALTQGGHLDGQHAQTVIQVRPELGFRRPVAQVAVGRRDDPDVHPARDRAADPLVLALLQHAEQLGLERRRDFGHFVQQQRAAVRQFETSLAHPISARERALLVFRTTRSRAASARVQRS